MKRYAPLILLAVGLAEAEEPPLPTYCTAWERSTGNVSITCHDFVNPPANTTVYRHRHEPTGSMSISDFTKALGIANPFAGEIGGERE